MSEEILTLARFPAPPDRDAVAAAWRTRGFSCHSFVDPPGRQWLDFVHDCNELVTVVEGRLKLEVAGHSVEAGPGDEVFIPRGARHSVFNVDAGTTTWLFGYD
ncbi:MAG: cupin domain-containing protein [Kiloniellales bacterium]|nr:cupin domain-containing protein [Kiloniellales bacterium]